MKRDLVIVGGGPAGLAAAVRAYESGVKDILIIERDKDLGGILAYPFGATDIIALMRGAEVVCSMRYHALVLAHVAGASFVGIGDDQKIKSFCSEYGGEYIDAKKTGR